MKDFNWTCPHCERAVTISEGRITGDRHALYIKNADGRRTLVTTFIACPNEGCTKFTLTASLYESVACPQGDQLVKELQQWALIPPSAAKHFPDYVPQAIREDYVEACLIRDRSPKASATPSRRCLL